MKKVLTLFALSLAAIALVACGSSSNNSSTSATSTSSGAAAGGGGGGGGQTLKLSADPGGALAYNTKSLTAKKPGNVTIDLNNPAALSHDVAVEDSSGKKLGVAPLVAQGKTSLSLNLKPGKYTFFCTVTGHRQAGMKGTLTVK
jgi:plastocyanin